MYVLLGERYLSLDAFDVLPLTPLVPVSQLPLFALFLSTPCTCTCTFWLLVLYVTGTRSTDISSTFFVANGRRDAAQSPRSHVGASTDQRLYYSRLRCVTLGPIRCWFPSTLTFLVTFSPLSTPQQRLSFVILIFSELCQLPGYFVTLSSKVPLPSAPLLGYWASHAGSTSSSNHT